MMSAISTSIDIEHLGSAYERLLESRGERKASGSYYTPRFIVDYIVRNTVGPLADEAAWKVAALRLELDKTISHSETDRRRLLEPYLSLSILDPAMGTGYFLVGAADFLSHAMATDPNLPPPVIPPGRIPGDIIPPGILPGGYDMSSKGLQAYYKRLVAENCLYGVDLDPMAVELAKLSLRLHTASRDESLPSLDDHLKCGNSLVGFDWENEFPEQYFGPSGPKPDHQRGFDAVIGNPPYLFGENIPGDIRAVSDSFRFATGQYDVYWLFYEKALTTLLKEGGYHGYIVPDAILARDEVGILRAELTEKHRLCCIIYAGRAFRDPNVNAAVLIWQKSGRNDAGVVSGLAEEGSVSDRIGCNQHAFAALPGNRWLIHLTPESLSLLSRIFAQSSGLTGISRGEELGKRDLMTSPQPDSVPVLVGEDICPLAYPIPSRYAKPEDLRKSSAKYASPKLVFVKTGQRIVATIDYDNLVTLQSVYNVHPGGPATRVGYIAALLHSSLLNWVAMKTFTDYHRMFPQFNQTTVAALPIRRIEYRATSDTRAQYLEQFKSDYFSHRSREDLFAFASAMLSQTPEHEEAVHDILAFLAEHMIELNKSKQHEVGRFLMWLEGHIGCPVNDLSSKTRVREYHAHSLKSLLTILNQNRQKLGVPLDGNSVVESIRQEFESGTAALAPIKQRITETEWLIDQIVYRLYGLNDEEIRIVEGDGT